MWSSQHPLCLCVPIMVKAAVSAAIPDLSHTMKAARRTMLCLARTGKQTEHIIRMCVAARCSGAIRRRCGHSTAAAARCTARTGASVCASTRGWPASAVERTCGTQGAVPASAARAGTLPNARRDCVSTRPSAGELVCSHKGTKATALMAMFNGCRAITQLRLTTFTLVLLSMLYSDDCNGAISLGKFNLWTGWFHCAREMTIHPYSSTRERNSCTGTIFMILPDYAQLYEELPKVEP